MIYPLVLNPFDANDVTQVKATIDSGQWTMGPKVKEFEQQFAKKAGVPFAVMVNSGSSANLAAMTAVLFHSKNFLKPGDEVIVPAIGWATTWAPLQQLGLHIKVVDVDPETLNINVDELEKAITARTKMVVTVTVLGNPMDFTRLRSVCEKHNVLLFEDNCESIGATHRQQWCGTFGFVGTFSFFYSHHISTIEGGMIVTHDEEMYELCLAARAHGWNREIPRASKLNQSLSERMKEQYQFIIPGYNLRPLEISGTLGLCQLPKLDPQLKIRRENALLFQAMMESHPKIQTQSVRDGESSWYAFTMILKNEGDNKDQNSYKNNDEQKRNQLFEFLHARGIESRMITGGSIDQQPMSRYFNLQKASDLRHANRAHHTGLFVANHGIPFEHGIKALDQALKEFGV